MRLIFAYHRRPVGICIFILNKRFYKPIGIILDGQLQAVYFYVDFNKHKSPE